MARHATRYRHQYRVNKTSAELALLIYVYLYANHHGFGPWFLFFASSCPVCDSCSRKFDHSSASDSLLAVPLSMNSAASVGVLGVWGIGVLEALSFPALEAPGRARPACSRCSVQRSMPAQRSWSQPTIGPAKERCNQLQDLEFLRV